MRTVAALVALACCVAAIPAAAQTCPPGDPLCTKDSPAKGKPKLKEADDSKPAEAPPPKAPDPVAAPPVAKPAFKSDEAPPQRGVITLAEVTITGRVQKPIAAVDVGRISPRLTLSELRQPFLDRIEKAIYSDPF
jgi:hypothetical protein